MLPLRAKVDLGAMAIKEYSDPTKIQHYWSLTIRLFIVSSRTHRWEVLLLCRGVVDVFYSPNRLGKKDQEIVIRIIKIYSLDIGIEFSIEKSPTLLRKSGKRKNVRNKTVEAEKHQISWEKGKLQVFGNNGNKHSQTRGDGRKTQEKNV